MLDGIWGRGNIIQAAQIRVLEANELPGETALQTCSRIAELDVSAVPAFRCDIIHYLVGVTERQRESEDMYYRFRP